MQLIIVTGLSGGGKSIAVRQLEDSGYYCIDNLPGEFLLPVAKSLAASGTRAAAVAIDARSHATFDKALEAFEELKREGFDMRVLFLTASNEELIRRFSETRRRHPLSTHAEHLDQELTLQEAIRLERNPRPVLPARHGGNSRGTAGVNSEEGGDDVRSSCPLRPGLHACYNGRYNGMRRREAERIPENRSQFGLESATRLHEGGVASNRESATSR